MCDDNYNLDLDENNMLLFTRKNMLLIKTCVTIDSAYRNAIAENDESAAHYIKTFLCDKEGHLKIEDEIIREICKRIDRENSTHLAVTANNHSDEPSAKNNGGLDEMVKRISLIDGHEGILEKRLRAADDLLVTELAEKIGRVRKCSFASKFCAIISIFAFNLDNYSKYDKVICDVLPYYAKKYLNENYYNFNRKKHVVSTIKNEFETDKGFNYKGYRELIDRIITELKKQEGNIFSENISENIINYPKDVFDMMLWYYYKGDNYHLRALEQKL